MPLPNEPTDIVPSGDFDLEDRDNLGQASVTFKAQSRRERPLGDGGETRGIAKREVDDVRQVLLGQRDLANQQAQARLVEIRDEAQHKLETEELGLEERQKLEERVSYLSKKIEQGWPDFDISSIVTQLPDHAQDEAIAKCVNISTRLKDQETTMSTAQPLISRPLMNIDTLELEIGEKDVHLLSRAVASSAVDQLLGTRCLAQEKFGMDGDGHPIGISVQVDGLGTMGNLPNGHTYFMDIDYSSHNVQKGLYDLEALDYITGQVDRHAGNIFIDPETGEVRGIDNDLAFPQMDRSEMLEQQGAPNFPVKNLPRYMHEDTARKIESLRPEDLRETLSNVGYPPDGARGKLTHEEIEGSVKRLQEMQQHIQTLRGEGRVVKQFTGKEYTEAVMHQTESSLRELSEMDSYKGTAVTVDTVTGTHLSSTGKTSYIGTIALEQHVSEKNIALGTGEKHSFDSLKVQLNSTGKAIRDEDFAEFTRLTENLRGQEKQQLTSMHTPQFAQLTSRLYEVEANIEKLKNPGVLGTLGAIPKGGPTSARRELEQERLEILQDIRDLERSIDERVEQLVDDQKEDLWVIAQHNVENPEMRLGPKPPQPGEPHYGSFEDFRGKQVVGAGGATGSGRVKVEGENFQLKGSIAHSGLGRRLKSSGLNHENYGEVIATNISKAVVGEDNRDFIPDVLLRQDEHTHEPKVTSRYLQGGKGDLDDRYRREMQDIDPKLALLPKDSNGKTPIIDENGKQKKHAYITLDPTKSTGPGVLALKDEAAQDVRRNIALSALMGDHDVNPGNMIDVGGTRVGRIDFGHAFNELITAPGGKMTGGGGVRFENNRILDFFNREKVSGGKLGGDPSKLWRDYDGIGPSQEMATALREVAGNKEALDGLVHAKTQFVDLIAELEAEGTPAARKEIEDLTKSLARISKNVGMPVTSTEPSDVAKEVFQNLDTFVREGQKQMNEVADLCSLQARIDTFLRDPANDGKKIPDDLPQEVKDIYKLLSENPDCSVKATNGQGLQFMKNSKSEKAFSGDLESYAKARQQVVRLERGEGPALNEIDKLEARKAQLQNNPSAGDHVKAFFKHGSKGVDGEIEQIEKQLETLRAAVKEVQQGVSLQDDRKQVEILKDSDRALKSQIEQLKDQRGNMNLARHFKIGEVPTDEQMLEVQRKIDQAELARAEVQAQIKKEEGVISVREKLGLKATPKEPLTVQSQQQGGDDLDVDDEDLSVLDLDDSSEIGVDEEAPKKKLERSQSVRDSLGGKTGEKTTTESTKRKVTM
ncbi:phosphatidylinositol 3-/4-kinase [Roseimicrobium gellanilyticum]|uniref:Phosphatidylinositol 3-/4-kinase n=1 Tax=Roseimicrobium gellanilyticum TaxID=748857 RepID=A0A366H0Z6_9BACT|nr:hypothetical protein [Roseimicrobium gellanilyticum]RBP35536.1 phosphatidylinositol 3-/4-kinase [Roseimicrobium gellanilyticum]